MAFEALWERHRAAPVPVILTSPLHQCRISAGHYHSKAPQLHLRVLQRTDGREALADMVAQLRNNKACQARGVSQEEINTYLEEKVCASPDLLLLLGRRPVLHGYPPWQLKRPEIL